MPYNLRISRTRAAEGPVAAVGGRPVTDLHQELVTALSRHGGAQAATVLAKPLARPDGHVEWYAAAAGQPVALTALPEAERRRAQETLRSRLEGLGRLAERLRAQDPRLAEALLIAAAAPAPEQVYVVGGQPVIVDWGRTPAAASPPPPPTSAAPVAPATPGAADRRAMPWVGAAAAMVAVALFALAAWWLWPHVPATLAQIDGALFARDTATPEAAPEAAPEATAEAMPTDVETLRQEIAAAEERLKKRLEACTTPRSG